MLHINIYSMRYRCEFGDGVAAVRLMHLRGGMISHDIYEAFDDFSDSCRFERAHARLLCLAGVSDLVQ
jgi:hypothetical protein